MKEWLDDIRMELQTMKTCVERLSEQIEWLEQRLEEAEKQPEPPSVSKESISATPVSSPRWIDCVNAGTSLRHGFSLNDSFRFTRELFKGDTVRMNRMLDALDEAGTLEMAIGLFKNEVALPDDNEAVVEFMELLRKHFN